LAAWETGAYPMGATADRLPRLLVVTHEPAESYAVDDFLLALDDEAAPTRLLSVSMWNSAEKGWTAHERPELEMGTPVRTAAEAPHKGVDLPRAAG
jgi:hypothetical protein